MFRLEPSVFTFELAFFSTAGLFGRACAGALERGMTTPWKVVWSCLWNGLQNGMMADGSGDATMGRLGLAYAGNGPVRGLNFCRSDLDLLSLQLSLLAQGKVTGDDSVRKTGKANAVCCSGPKRGAMVVEHEDIRPGALLPGRNR